MADAEAVQVARLADVEEYQVGPSITHRRESGGAVDSPDGSDVTLPEVEGNQVGDVLVVLDDQ